MDGRPPARGRSSPYHVGFGNRGGRPLAAPANITAMAASRLAQVWPWLGASRIFPISPRRRMCGRCGSVARVGAVVTRGLGVKHCEVEACRLAQQDPSPLLLISWGSSLHQPRGRFALQAPMRPGWKQPGWRSARKIMSSQRPVTLVDDFWRCFEGDRDGVWWEDEDDGEEGKSTKVPFCAGRPPSRAEC